MHYRIWSHCHWSGVEFDYSGTQAAKRFEKTGFKIVSSTPIRYHHDGPRHGGCDLHRTLEREVHGGNHRKEDRCAAANLGGHPAESFFELIGRAFLKNRRVKVIGVDVDAISEGKTASFQGDQ